MATLIEPIAPEVTIREPLLSDLATACADYIQVHGLTHNLFWEENGAVCAVGAINQVTGAEEVDDAMMDEYDTARNRLVVAMMHSLGVTKPEQKGDDAIDVVTCWNDGDGMYGFERPATESEVINQFRRLAQDLREQGL